MTVKLRWAALVTALASPLLLGQSGGPEATIYRDLGYRGPAVAVQEAQPNLRLSWPVTSIRVTRGRWQLCAEPNYRGMCITVDRSEPNIAGRLGPRSALQSMRPMGGGGGGGGGGDTGNPGPSLRGMASEFFPAPRRFGERIPACARGSATAQCAATTADAFCRQRGWTGSAREALETVSRRVMLADVLCTRTGY
ncbi:beta/gamma crystallin-related protein [Sphingomonas sp. FW199]|uniref:beta/gamma crystallin-related protein n=1 Tax=Sphingomonas sp. FW199 TaxID=3400217 RepID=UPI003CF6F9B3